MKSYSKFLQKPRYRIHCKELSEDLALSILETEQELEKKPTLELIQNLTNLYTQAIEHYESQENPNYLDFQEKLQKLLIRPQVFSILSKSAPVGFKNPATIPETPSSLLSTPENSPKSKSEYHRRQLSQQLSYTIDPHQSSDLLNTHSDLSKSSSNFTVSALKQQETSLEDKISARKLKRINRKTSYSLVPDLSCIEHDSLTTTKSSLSSLQDFKDNFERYEKALEGIMDSNLTQRAIKILEIQEKYQKKIEKSRGQEYMSIIIAQLQSQMNNEIYEISQEFDIKRQVEIQKAKTELYS